MTLNKKAEEKKIVIAIKNRFTGVIIFESTQTTWKKAVEEANLREANLRGADLRGADLRGANLCEANLREANLRWADLGEADLREANLRGADLREADLREADLRGADAGNAKFSGKTDNPKILKKSQVNDFLVMLGFKIK